MNRWSITGIFFVIFLNHATSQLPPRLQIPGAIGVGGSRPTPFRPQSAPSPRLRRPNAISSGREVRPVVEDIEEPNYPSPSPTSTFDDEVNKLGLSLQSSRDDDEEYRYRSGSSERATPLPFRPERPVPIAREQIREKTVISRPPPTPQRPAIRQDLREDSAPIRQAPVRQQVSRPQTPQTFRAAPVKVTQRQQALDDDDDDLRDRRRKPVPQILRKFRTDNEDGSITWGFETDDGTFKEETLGADCIIRGNYGYVDPDGVKREFSYETGNKCDEPDPDDDEPLPVKQNIPQSKNRPLPYSRPAASQPQYVN